MMNMMPQLGSGLYGQPPTNNIMQMPSYGTGTPPSTAQNMGSGLQGLFGNPAFGMGMGLTGGFGGVGGKRTGNSMQDMMQGLMMQQMLQRTGLYGQQS